MRTKIKGFSIITMVILFLIALTVVIAQSTSAANTVVKADLPDGVQPGETFNLSVTIRDVDAFDAGQFDIRFDSSEIEVTGFENGSIDGTVIPIDFGFLKEADIYRVLVNVPNTPGVDGDGTLAILKCRALKEGETSVEIGWLDNETGIWGSAFINNNEAKEIPATYYGDSTLFYPQEESPIWPQDPIANMSLIIGMVIYIIWRSQPWLHRNVSLDWLGKLFSGRSVRL